MLQTKKGREKFYLSLNSYAALLLMLETFHFNIFLFIFSFSYFSLFLSKKIIFKHLEIIKIFLMEKTNANRIISKSFHTWRFFVVSLKMKEKNYFIMIILKIQNLNVNWFVYSFIISKLSLLTEKIRTCFWYDRKINVIIHE